MTEKKKKDERATLRPDPDVAVAFGKLKRHLEHSEDRDLTVSDVLRRLIETFRQRTQQDIRKSTVHRSTVVESGSEINDTVTNEETGTVLFRVPREHADTVTELLRILAGSNEQSKTGIKINIRLFATHQILLESSVEGLPESSGLTEEQVRELAVRLRELNERAESLETELRSDRERNAS